MANAVHNHQMAIETLVIERAFVNQAGMLKRFVPKSMGRATPIRKRLCHVTVVLAGQVDTALAKKKKAEAAEATEKKEKKEQEQEVKKATKKPAAKKVTKKKTTPET